VSTLAHGGGIPELLTVVVPLALVIVLLRAGARKMPTDEPAPGPADGHAAEPPPAPAAGAAGVAEPPPALTPPGDPPAPAPPGDPPAPAPSGP
jgi:hypothetical protein